MRTLPITFEELTKWLLKTYVLKAMPATACCAA